MAASYPSSVKTFTTKVDGAGNIIFAAHVNDLQDEVTVIEQALLTVGFAHDLKPSTDAVRALGAAGARFTDLFLSSSVRVGTNPAASGVLRIPNTASIVARNAANTADIPLAFVDTANNIQMGASGVIVAPASDNLQDLGSAVNRWQRGYFGTAVIIGSDPGSGALLRVSGDVRMGPNAFGLNTDPVPGVHMAIVSSAAGNIPLRIKGAASQSANLLEFQDSAAAGLLSVSAGGHILAADNVTDLGGVSNRFKDGYFGTSVRIGTNPGATGGVRLPNGVGAGSIIARNAANTADLQVAGYTTGNILQIGDSGNSGLELYGGAGAFIQFDSAARTSTANRFRYKQSMVEAKRTTAQSVPNATWTSINLDAEEFDTDALHDTVTNNTRLTANLTGKYWVYARGEWAPNATGIRNLRLKKNGATYDYIITGPNAGGADGLVQSGGLLVSLVATDYMEVEAFQTSGGALNMSTARFGMVYIGE